jgi:hypothetical protein
VDIGIDGPLAHFLRPRKFWLPLKRGQFSGYLRRSPAISGFHFIAQKVTYLSFYIVRQLYPAIAAAIAGDLKLW